ncbi:NUDIX domain-containing protein [Demequina litorisediminis]|uniref:NUDIX domain-containing protein n=1 Tax=Demequina litorisediminis TaxID=1849022 RepID=UPI0024E0853F|nr:NUDIX domain-containing protein [Demequina litorisediminis]
MIRREGARVLLLDDEGRLLVMRAHDSHRPERSWWFTPGGGIEPGESAAEAAAREPDGGDRPGGPRGGAARPRLGSHRAV